MIRAGKKKFPVNPPFDREVRIGVNPEFCTEERGKKVMTATNIFYNFVGFVYSPPLVQN